MLFTDDVKAVNEKYLNVIGVTSKCIKQTGSKITRKIW